MLKKLFLAVIGLVGLAQTASAAVITPEQTTALTTAMTSGFNEYWTVLIAIAAIAIPMGIIVGLIWKFMPRIKGRGI